MIRQRILQIIPETHGAFLTAKGDRGKTQLWRVHAWALVEESGITTVQPMIMGQRALMLMSPYGEWELDER